MTLFFFQAEDGIRDLVRSRGLGDVYKRQEEQAVPYEGDAATETLRFIPLAAYDSATCPFCPADDGEDAPCLLYTSDAADERSSVDLGGRRIIKKKKMR